MAPAEFVAGAVRAILEDGVVRISRVWEPSAVDCWKQAFMTRTLRQISSTGYQYRKVSLGQCRDHFVIEIHREFNSPDFYAAPPVYSIAKSLLGPRFILATVASAYSIKGSNFQHVHRDMALLFDQPLLDQILPPASITVGFPLVATNDLTGGTEFQLRSHREANVDESVPFIHTGTEPGDCLIWDSRLVHRGRPNGGGPRPLILFYYHRPWFFNFVNHWRDSEIKITDRSLDLVPDRFRHLFAWSRNLFTPPEFSKLDSGLCSCGSGESYDACHGCP